MNRNRVLTTALAVAASVAMTACSTTVVGVPVASAGGTGKAAAVAMPVTPPKTPAAATQQWRDVSNARVRQDHTPARAQFGTVPLPGITVIRRTSLDDGYRCTLGPAVRGDGTDGFITAGHCLAVGTSTAEIALQADFAGVDIRDWAEAMLAERDTRDPLTGTLIDSSVIWTGGPAPMLATEIAGAFPVAGVMTIDGVKSLMGKMICFDGAMTGVRCGPLTSTDDGGMLSFAAVSQVGDSGAVVFAVDSKTSASTLLGVLEGGDAANTTATYLDPALRRLDAKVLVDRTAASSVAGDSRYSTLTAVVS
jgi:hypothetical protein